ncbi:hypothetical protein [Aquimarina sp. AU474]|uniref:hypothetical protein n=1 Tax=Aquimarina sp. AU474 TaxID=2108529 RepID=UPI000D6895A0|nr:hypothetical protein [Aquimarina sp. AU474]
MKKTIVTTCICLLLATMISCKKDPKTDKLDVVETVQDSTAVAVEEVVEEKKPVVKKKKKKKTTKKKKPTIDDKAMRIPGTFDTTENTHSKKFIKDYERYVANYKKAVKAHDMDSFLKLGDASSDLSRQYNRLMSILPGEEISKLSEYMQVKSKQINELSAQM